MTCYLGELDSGSKAELERHLDACARCRRAASEAETSIQSFSGALSAQRPEPELAGRVMAAVRAAAQDSAGEGPARRAVFLAPCVRWGAVAVALLVALAVGIALLRGEPGDDTGSPRPAPLVADGPEEPTPSDQELPPWPDAPSADEEAPPAGDAVAEWYEPPVPRAPWRAMPDVVAAPGALVGVDDAGRLVELGDGSTLELDAEARLTLGPVPDDGARPAYVTLDAGRMMADIEPGGGPFEVRTPHGTATVLGTRFLLSARGDRSVLLVIEGSVEFGNADDSVTVGQMQRCECRSDRPPADPTQVTRVRWEGRTWTGPDRVVQAPADPAPRETEAEPLPDDQQMPKTIGELIADLSHADAAVRVAGAGGLADPEGPVASAGEAELKPAVPPLIAMLREEDAGAQASAASALATVAEKVPDRDAMAPTVAPLIVVLDSPQAEARLNAALALKALAFSSGDEAMLTPAVIPLMAALYDADDEARGAAAYALKGAVQRIDAHAVVAAMIEPLTRAIYDDHEGVLRQAMAALTFAITKLDDRGAAEQVMPRILELLGHEIRPVRWFACVNLRMLARHFDDAEALETAFAAAVDLARDEDTHTRVLAIGTLANFAGDGEREVDLAVYLPGLIASLSDADPTVQSQAARVLGSVATNLSDKPSLNATVEPLTRLLSHDDAGTRQYAARALGAVARKIDDYSSLNATIDPLLTMLGGDDTSDPTWAAYCLILVAPLVPDAERLSAAVEPLTRVVGHDDSLTRYYAARALQEVGFRLYHEDALSAAHGAFVSLLQDPGFSYRARALREVGRTARSLGGEAILKDTLDAMVAACDDPDPKVRRAAVSAISSSVVVRTDRDAYELVFAALTAAFSDEDRETRNNSAAALAVVATRLRRVDELQPVLGKVFDRLTQGGDGPGWYVRAALKVVCTEVEDEAVLDHAVERAEQELIGGDPTAWDCAAELVGHAAPRVGRELRLPAIAAMVSRLEPGAAPRGASIGVWLCARDMDDDTPLHAAVPGLHRALRKGDMATLGPTTRALTAIEGIDRETMVDVVREFALRVYDVRPAARALAVQGIEALTLRGTDPSVLLASVDALADALLDEAAVVRFSAANAVSSLCVATDGAEELDILVTPLMAGLQDYDAGVRWASARAAGRLGRTITDEAALGEMVSELGLTLTDAFPAVRWSGASALATMAQRDLRPGEWGDVLPDVTAALEDEHPRVRRSAASVLTRLGSPDAVSAVADPVALARSTFDTDAEGWSCLGDAFGFRHRDGHIRAYDLSFGTTMGWRPPSEFMGDISRAYGGTLDFELRQGIFGSETYDDDDITLVGGGTKLVYDAPYSPGVDWTPYSVQFHESGGWRRGTTDGPLATRDELLAVLSDVQHLRIRSEFTHYFDACAIDNVVLRAGPVQ